MVEKDFFHGSIMKSNRIILPPINPSSRNKASKMIESNKTEKNTSLIDYNDRIFQLNRKYYKPPPPKPMSLSDIALQLLDKKQFIEFRKMYPKLAELEK